MRYPLIVFDWDGTITDSHSAIVACMQEASRELGLAIPERERASHVIGLSLHEILRIVAPDLPAERYPEYVAAYRKHFLAREEAIQLFPGMHGLLEGLSRKHLLGIATVTYGAHPEEGLRACGPLGCFSDVAQLRQWLKSNA
jgi:phosphoglycolate phosphatase